MPELSERRRRRKFCEFRRFVVVLKIVILEMKKSHHLLQRKNHSIAMGIGFRGGGIEIPDQLLLAKTDFLVQTNGRVILDVYV